LVRRYKVPLDITKDVAAETVSNHAYHFWNRGHICNLRIIYDFWNDVTWFRHLAVTVTN
jgi:hypothetical protein